MSLTNRRTVITGFGPVTPLGTGSAVVWEALASGTSAIRPFQNVDTDVSIAPYASEVIDFDPKKYVKNKKSIKVMARDIQLAVGAADMALKDAGVVTTQLDPARFGVNCGAGLIATELDELGPPLEKSYDDHKQFDLKRWGKDGLPELFPLWMLKYLPNMPACHISITYDAQGPNNSVTAGEASSLLAMGEAFRVLQRNAADLFVTGGCDSKIHPLSITRQAMLNRISKKWTDDPSQASRPFDRDRDGIITGEGAAMLIFEDLEHARARKAKVLAEVIGYAATCHPSNRAYAVERCVNAAVADAGITVDDLGVIFANAASSIKDDRAEAIGLAKTVGERVPIVALKSYLGQTAAGSGAIELCAALMCMAHDQLVPTLNFVAMDDGLAPLDIVTQTRPFPDKPFLVYGISHSGQCAALVVRAFAA